MKTVGIKTSNVRCELVPGDLAKIKEKYYKVMQADVSFLCREPDGVYCAGWGKPGICKALPDCSAGIVFIKLSGRELRQAIRNGKATVI
jgi:hypothetical protein